MTPCPLRSKSGGKTAVLGRRKWRASGIVVLLLSKREEEGGGYNKEELH